jgi:SsrA-binding protein
VEQRGYTLVPLDLHYSKGRVKLQVGLAKGKKQYDKRQALRERQDTRDTQRALHVRGER